jgi:hypothetical protein
MKNGFFPFATLRVRMTLSGVSEVVAEKSV